LVFFFLQTGNLVPPHQWALYRGSCSHEVISCGFWPGDETFKAPAFFSYTFPEPPGLSAAALRPSAAWYNPDRGLFLLRYEDMRSADAPEQVLLEFLQSTYEAGATLAQWDRETLKERHHHRMARTRNRE
jgi:hypothetical protein